MRERLADCAFGAKGIRRVLVVLVVQGLVLLGSAASAAAQTVTGAVLDAATSAPLTGVLVSLLDLNGERLRGALTDDAGRFHFDTDGFGRFSLRAERIGLQGVTSATFDLVTNRPHFERILMGSRAVEIAGLVVDGRVRQCRSDPAEAVQIQRWWREVRTALDVSSVVQTEGIASFQISRFEREWDDELRRISASNERQELSQSNRPFVSEEADVLAERGYVQGDPDGYRQYFAPDAEVLLSSTFLADHCFRVVEHDDFDEWIGLAFEPTRDSEVADILGTLWVDSSTAELQNLEFRYANVQGLPSNESGGFVGFEYLPSGAWIVREWYIRMPRLASQRVRGGSRLVLLGYLDVGGEVRPIERNSVSADRMGGVGTIRGIVYDSIRGRGLSGALVSLLGTRYQVRSDATGAFTMPDVPAGEHGLTFFHDDPEAWGLGSPYRTVEVEGDMVTEVYLALPAFRAAATALCLGTGAEARTVLIGRLVDAEGKGLGNTRLELTWEETAFNRSVTEHELEARTGSDGDFVVCTIPAESIVTLVADIENRLIPGFTVQLPDLDIVYRQVQIPIRW